jgi:hypothetical protein
MRQSSRLFIIVVVNGGVKLQKHIAELQLKLLEHLQKSISDVMIAAEALVGQEDEVD